MYEDAYFYCFNTAITIVQILKLLSLLSKSFPNSHLKNLVENHIAAVLLDRCHAPCKEGHLGEKISGSPGHHNVETELKDGERCQDNLRRLVK